MSGNQPAEEEPNVPSDLAVEPIEEVVPDKPPADRKTQDYPELNDRGVWTLPKEPTDE